MCRKRDGETGRPVMDRVGTSGSTDWVSCLRRISVFVAGKYPPRLPLGLLLGNVSSNAPGTISRAFMENRLSLCPLEGSDSSNAPGTISRAFMENRGIGSLLGIDSVF